MKIQELDTPALLIDLDRVERNLDRLADYCRQHRLRLRPHIKTHKLPELARMQVERGAWGITVAKVGEAEVMATGGLDNILIAYSVLGPAKAGRVAALARERAISVALDSREAAEAVSAAAAAAGVTLDVLVEIDTGFHRCGVPFGGEEADAAALMNLARAIASVPGLRFAGIMSYPGHIIVEPARQAELLREQNEILGRAVAVLESNGLDCEVVSGGSTPTRFNSHLMPRLTEVRCGTYIFNDRNTVHMKAALPEECALSVLVTVASTAVERQIIVDGGSKTFSSDRHLAGAEMGYGEVLGRPDLLLTGLSEEHGWIAAPEGRGAIRVGDRLRILMNHACACVHLHEQAYAHRGDEVVACYRVAARGKLQ